MTASLGERGRAELVAAAVAQAAFAAGRVPDDGLLIWALAGGRPEAAPPVGGPAGAGAGADRGGIDGDDLGGDDRDDGEQVGPDVADAPGAALEAATDDGRRRAQGLHVTPPWLAAHLVRLALPTPAAVPAAPAVPALPTVPISAVATAVPEVPAVPALLAVAPAGGWPTVCDPACGGGAFLVAAARRLHGLGAPRRQVVRHLLWGADIDPVGLAAAEAALWLWAGERPPPGRLVVADPLLAAGEVWPDAPGGFGAVVGNPPFQSQLGRATARSAGDQRRVRARFGPAVRAYTDTAWLFLLAGCDLVRPGGRVVMVEPQSVVAARDAEAVRRAIDERATLCDLWVDDGRVFSAAVRVCAPVLERRAEVASPTAAAAGAAGEAPMPTVSGTGESGVGPGQPVGGDRWGRLWARALDLPLVYLAPGPTLGELAVVVAGFRDQYYGLIDVVREHDPCDPPGGAPLVTSGALDWAACAWGERPARYAKRRWQAPVVDLARLATDAPPVAQRWVARTRAPKLVVATQTRVVEAAVDVAGTWVPSVPTLAVVPADPDDLWRLAAAVLSPAATAWLVRRAAGTGLDRGALKVSGPHLVELPLPADRPAWDAAADALRAYVAAPGPPALDIYLEAAGRAYGTPPTLTTWWRHQARTAVRTAAPDG
jgi:hypothetical protein